MNTRIIKKLSARKPIYLAETDNGEKVVIKNNRDTNSCQLETKIFEQLSVSGYAPKVLESGDDYIVYEYIEGDSFKDKFINYTATNNEEGLIRLANELSIYLQIFYMLASGYIIKDIHFSNFIIKDARCYGIDYDSVGEGMQYTDIAGIIAHALLTCENYRACTPFIKQILKNFHEEMINLINDIRLYLENQKVEFDIDGLLEFLLAFDDKN